MCLLWFRGTQGAEPYWLSEMGDSMTGPGGNRLKSWDARCVNKLFPGACWQLGFLTGASWREKAGKSDPQAAACKVCNQIPSKEGLGDKDFPCPSVLVPAGTASASSQRPVSTCIFAALGWDLCSRAPLAVRAGRWGPDARSKHFCHQGKLRAA